MRWIQELIEGSGTDPPSPDSTYYVLVWWLSIFVAFVSALPQEAERVISAENEEIVVKWSQRL